MDISQPRSHQATAPGHPPRNRSGRVTPTVLGTVLLAALTAVGGLPVAAAGIASTGGGAS